MRGICFKKRWLVFVVALAVAVVAVPAAFALTFTASIDGSEPTQTGRLTRDGIAATCAAPKTNSLIDTTGARHYDLYEFVNTSGSTQCVTVTYKATINPCVVFAPAYLGSFNPADPAANYLADGGLSSGAGGENITVTYSFEVASGAHFVIVAHEVEPGDGCVEYQLEVTGTGIVSADAAQAIGDLRDLVASMDIHHGIANALDAKLQAALAALEADDTAGACDSLQAFLNQVSAQTGKKLTDEQAEELTDAANAIREQLDC